MALRPTRVIGDAEVNLFHRHARGEIMTSNERKREAKQSILISIRNLGARSQSRCRTGLRRNPRRLLHGHSLDEETYLAALAELVDEGVIERISAERFTLRLIRA